MILIFECWILSQLFHFPLSFSSRGSLVPLHFCHKGGVICISEVIDISPCNLNSCLCFILHGVCSAYKLNKQGDNIQPWHTPFPIWNQSVVVYLGLTVASWPAYRFLRRQVRLDPVNESLFQDSYAHIWILSPNFYTYHIINS